MERLGTVLGVPNVINYVATKLELFFYKLTRAIIWRLRNITEHGRLSLFLMTGAHVFSDIGHLSHSHKK